MAPPVSKNESAPWKLAPFRRVRSLPLADESAAVGPIAPRSATWPALASALTGLYPSAHGLIKNGYSFSDEIDMLPQALGRVGYRTGAFLRNMCRANHRGWDELACARSNSELKAMVMDWPRPLAVPGAQRPGSVW